MAKMTAQLTDELSQAREQLTQAGRELEDTRLQLQAMKEARGAPSVGLAHANVARRPPPARVFEDTHIVQTLLTNAAPLNPRISFSCQFLSPTMCHRHPHGQSCGHQPMTWHYLSSLIDLETGYQTTCSIITFVASQLSPKTCPLAK